VWNACTALISIICASPSGELQSGGSDDLGLLLRHLVLHLLQGLREKSGFSANMARKSTGMPLVWQNDLL
jgi:hypothetical protein